MVLLGMCSGNSSSQRSSASVVKIRIASDLADDAPKSVALYQFEKDVESASNNEIDVEVYTNNALGGELQYHDSIVDGSVEMVTAGTGFASRFHPYAAFDTPFLIASWEEAQKVFDSDYAQKVFDNMISGVGVRFLAFTPIGFRVFASVKEIDSMDDFSGMRCRAPAIPVYLKLIGNLGANPVAFPLGELFTALEQKACEALELPVGTISTNKYYEVAKYILDTKHMMTVQSLVVNEKFFQSLSEKHKEVVIDASKKLQKNCIDYYVEYEKSVLTEMASNGAIVNEPSADFMNKLRASQNNIIQIIEEEHLGAAQVVAGIGRILGR
jgi:tripartite ATP-independent transporter DctP family solute receptor